MIFQTKQHNTRHAFKATLYEPNGEPLNLTDCEVLFRMKSKDGLTIDRAMQVVGTGGVILVFAPEEVANQGVFLAEITVIFPDGRKEFYPSEGYVKVYINSSLGGNQ